MVTDRELIDATARGLDIEPEPFARVASELGLSQEEVIERIGRMIEQGKVRRFAASVRHQPVGYSYNAMVMARVEPGRIEEAGKKARALEQVSHCYQRAHPEGDENCLYVMVHGKKESEVADAVDKVKALQGVRSVEVCRSTLELKKTSLSGVTTVLDEDE